VLFADGQSRDLRDLRGRITVLWFFLPDDAGLADDLAKLGPFVAECRNLAVSHLALGASLAPEGSLNLVRLRSFGFPAGTYRYDERQALTGVTMFPTVVVLDPAGDVVYRSTSRTEYQSLVRGMLASPAYASMLESTGTAAAQVARR
jgi:hypothetical protein